MKPNPLHDQFRRIETRLSPRWAARVRWLREPSSRYARIPVGGALIAGGLFFFLPILGLWMLPLGVIVIAQDIPPLQKPMANAVAWGLQYWPRKE